MALNPRQSAMVSLAIIAIGVMLFCCSFVFASWSNIYPDAGIF